MISDFVRTMSGLAFTVNRRHPFKTFLSSFISCRHWRSEKNERPQDGTCLDLIQPCEDKRKDERPLGLLCLWHSPYEAIVLRREEPSPKALFMSTRDTVCQAERRREKLSPEEE